MTDFVITIRVRGSSDQPVPWVTAISAAAIQGILDGIAADVVVTDMTDMTSTTN